MRSCRVFLLLLIARLAAAQPIDSLSSINSRLDEQNPVLSPDGKTLFFTISNNAQNVGGTKDLGDIWYSLLSETGWSTPVHGGKLINNGGHNTVAGFSSDGFQLFIMGHYATNGPPVSQGLSVSLRNGESWGAPQNIVIPYFKNKTPFQSGAVSADGRVLVFSAESYFTLGAEDIYVSVLSNGKWSEPKNLGKVVNTKMQDVSPSLSADNKRLYFASNGHGGAGSFDIFYSERLDDTWLNWSKPTSVEGKVNTEGRELFYRVFPAGSFYTSTLNSDGYGDIRYAQPEKRDSVIALASLQVQAEFKDTATVKMDEIVYDNSNGNVRMVNVAGKVLNAKTSEGVTASLHFISEGKTWEAASAGPGDYRTILPGVNEYHIRVEAPGYIGVLEKLDLRTQVLAELEMSFKLQPIEVGATVNLKSVLFQQSTPILLADSYDELDMVADFMLTNPKIEIELGGHTDNRGYHQLNMKLSRERVDEVKKYLVSKGIESKRITGRGYGGTRPIADNDADETRALNRRVEFTIVKD